MAWRWQSMSDGLVKSSTWWTVLTTTGGGPAAASLTLAAARAEMQSWVCRMGRPATRSPSPAASASTLAKTRSSSVGRLGGASMMVNGAATGRKKPAAGSPSAITRTGYPAACSASASASVCTTPPRGLTE